MAVTKGSTAQEPRWRVVVVDDDAPSACAVVEAVRALGGVVPGVGATGAEALALVDHHRPDVVILAAGLSGGDGLDAAAAVMKRFPCAIVLLTGRTDRALAERAGASGAMALLLKPLGTQELGAVVDLAVARFRELVALRQENEDLRRAIESRKLVERAKRLLMEREGLTEADAFRRIQKTAMNARRTMATIAEAILLSESVRR